MPIDARLYQAPDSVPGLIEKAERRLTQQEVAARLGVTPRYLRQLSRRERQASYGFQVTLEILVAEVTM